MTEHHIINVPMSAACRYVVTTDRRIDHPEKFILDVLTATFPATGWQLAALLQEMILASTLRIISLPADDSPCQAHLARVAAPPKAHERLLSASRHLIIDSQVSPADQPHRARLIRYAAQVLADAAEGQLADLCTSELVPHALGSNGERGWFRFADQWLSTNCLINPGSDDIPSTQRSCVCLLTRGLARFGLAELVIEHLPRAYNQPATNLLRGMAVRLLTQLWREPGTPQLRIGQTTTITPKHIWAYWGARPQHGEPIDIAVANPTNTDLLPDRHLAIVPHPNFNGTLTEWAAQTLHQPMLHIAQWHPDEPPYRIDTPLIPLSP